MAWISQVFDRNFAETNVSMDLKKGAVSTRPSSQFSTTNLGISDNSCVAGWRPTNLRVMSRAHAFSLSFKSVGAVKRVCTTTLPQCPVPQMSSLEKLSESVRSVGLRQHVPDRGSVEGAVGSRMDPASHQWSMQGVCLGVDQLEALAEQMALSSGGLPNACTVGTGGNIAASRTPATWLCSSGKISGMVVSSWTPKTMPQRKTGMHAAARHTITQGHFAVKSTSEESAR
mmetsp:Transcript_44456/g.123008  ORF Transcript_44456/g.123008 Transcript_44456/m.123008 type:complete len:229 (+) Transcript_44456:227-913(+)